MVALQVSVNHLILKKNYFSLSFVTIVHYSPRKNYFFIVLSLVGMWGDVLGVERGLALDDGKYLREPLLNTTFRVANMLMNLWQMMFIPFTT